MVMCLAKVRNQANAEYVSGHGPGPSEGAKAPGEATKNSCKVMADLALPNRVCVPSKRAEGPSDASVPADISRKFRFPKKEGVVCREAQHTASSVTVPEAAVHKHCDVVGGEYDVGTPGKKAFVEAVSVSLSGERPLQGHFCIGVCPADPSHLGAALGRG